MELEDLKSTWKSVEPHIENEFSIEPSDIILSKKKDVKSRLLRRVCANMAITIIGFVMMATYRLWSPAFIPVSWAMTFLLCILIGLVFELYLVKVIRGINISDKYMDVFKTIICIKRGYKRMELFITIAVVALIVWISFVPPYSDPIVRTIIWGVSIVAFTTELVIYRNNIANLNELVNNEDVSTEK